MHIEISAGPNIEVHEALADRVAGDVESALNRFGKHVTRVKVHLSDQNSDKKVGHDAMRCMIEARLEGRRPIAVTHLATTLDAAVDGAAGKLAGMIESTQGRQRHLASQRADPDPSRPGPKTK
jgi:ribosome-associated translation inhibitor RaiA